MEGLEMTSEEPLEVFGFESELHGASFAGDLDLVRKLLGHGLDDGAEIANVYFEDSLGRTALMVAAEEGHFEIVKALIEEGAQWNAVDHEGKTAAEYAERRGHMSIYDFLLNHGIQCELLLSVLENQEPAETEIDNFDKVGISNEEYLKSSLVYQDGKLIDENGDGVMMSWETPLMVEHARLLDVTGKDILNVGFGLGIIDTEIQKLNPRSHTIIEAHPEVYKYMLSKGWDKKPGVKIVFGRWQDVVENGKLSPDGYDGVFFDTFGEYYKDLRDFHENLCWLVRPLGVYSFFNGLAAKNAFFHKVYCNIVELELRSMGMSIEWSVLPISTDDPNIWTDISRKYFTLKEYRLPTCKFMT